MVLLRTIFAILTLSGLYVCNSNAAATFPRGCEISGFGYNGTSLVFNETGEQSFYLVQNRSTRTLQLQRPPSTEFMSPPLLAKLQPQNWGAFASNMQNSFFECFFADNETLEKTDCRDALEVCQYPRAKFALSNMGNYWASIDKNQQQTIKDSTSKGIFLRW